MQYEWDEQKRRVNLEKHGEDFGDAVLLDWSRAHISRTHAMTRRTTIRRFCPAK